MQIVQGNEVPKLELDNIRGGEVFTRSLMSGERGPDHFGLVLYYAGDDFFSPRHHHTFDQFRYQLDGEADFEHDGKMRQGTLGYFPEATYYGPTRGGGTVAVLQYGGPSGSGYMDIGQVKKLEKRLEPSESSRMACSTAIQASREKRIKTQLRQSGNKSTSGRSFTPRLNTTSRS